MSDIEFSAFSFLKKRLNNMDVDCTSSPMVIPDDIIVDALIEHCGMPNHVASYAGKNNAQ